MIPSTTERVPAHTPEDVNEQIRRAIVENVAVYANEGPEAIERRLAELDEEWDIERALEANAASVSLAGTFLGLTGHRVWFLLPGAVAGFLLQHAVQGWCPPIGLFRRLGFRTAFEIDCERYALKVLRGDFDGIRRTGDGVDRDTVHDVLDRVAR